ncbi:TaqI family restriction endonuclease [Patescibacteria group bacterium]|nr:TaqI family restriction endonuclease [Patescibacteria group bacterium]
MYLAEKLGQFLESVNLNAYREKYSPIKIVEMDLPKEIQAIEMPLYF